MNSEENRMTFFRGRKVELVLFFLLWGTYAYFYQSTQHNEAARFDQMRAIVHDQTLVIDKYWWNSADVIHYSRNGTEHIYPNKAPGGALLRLTPFALLTLLLQPLLWLGVPEWIYWHILSYLTVLGTVSLVSSLAAVGTFCVLRKLTGDTYAALSGVVAVWLGTLVFPYSTLFFSHQLAGACVTLAFILLLDWKLRRRAERGGFRTRFVFFAAGSLLGCSVISEYPTAILAVLLSCYAAWLVVRQPDTPQQKLTLLSFFAAGAGLCAILLVSYNLAAFGKWAYVPLEAYTAPGSAFPTYTSGFLGFRWNGWAAFLHALGAVTVRPTIGVLYLGVEHWIIYGCNPVLWLAVAGIGLLISRRETRAEGVLTLAMTVSYLLFVTTYGKWEYDWGGGSFFGVRHLVPLFGLLALPIAVVARRLRWLFYPLLAVSVFYMLLGTAVEPRIWNMTPNPLRDILLPEYLRGHLAQNTAALFGGEHLLTKDSTAFNLGKLAGLPRQYQLAPLMLWWLLAGGALLALAARSQPEERRWIPRVRFACLLAFVSFVTVLPIAHHAASATRQTGSGLRGKYYRNLTWSGKPVDERVDRTIDFDWSQTMPLQPPFSVEWSGQLIVEQAGNYTFTMSVDDGALLEIDGQPVLDLLHGPILSKRDSAVTLMAGWHAVRIRYFNELFGGSIHLWWRAAGRLQAIVPEEALSPDVMNAQQ